MKKRQKDISGIGQKIISLYAKGMITRQISETIEDIYGIVFVDAVRFSIRDNGQIRKLAAYVILAASLTGHKEVLSIHIDENESAKYWLSVLNESKKPPIQSDTF